MSTKLGVHRDRQRLRTVDAVVPGTRLDPGTRVECGACRHLLCRLRDPGIVPPLCFDIRCPSCRVLNRVGPTCRVIG